MHLRLAVLALLGLSLGLCCAKKASGSGSSLLLPLDDPKAFKKLLRTKNNVLVAFFGATASGETLKTLKSASEGLRGVGTLCLVECSGSGKKLCKKLKVSPSTQTPILKHYKDGDFHKDYQRTLTLRSLVTFMKDPTGDLPWYEEPAAADVQHVMEVAQFNKMVKKEAKLLVMFYAPWCGFCNRMKPDYQLAASEVKGARLGSLGAVDVTRTENSPLAKKYNVTGYPTLLYFQDGKLAYNYPGENNLAAIVDFMKKPTSEAPVKEVEVSWKDENPSSEVAHLTDSTFDSFLGQEDSVLVMFYAPWCGHCKRLKPHFDSAAAKMKELGTEGRLAAVDCTTERELAQKFEVKGYPTVKFFRSGEFAFNAGHARDEAELLKFMADPSEPPPPPPPEKEWAEEESAVLHLTDESFRTTLKKKKNVLVMFYAPWCGHCKKAKPEMSTAADHFSDTSKVELAAVDCTVHKATCQTYDVSGYPTFKFFKYFDKESVRSYDGGRTAPDFISFLEDPDNPLSGHPPPPPPPEQTWAEHEGAEHVKHLTDGTFDAELAGKEHVLVMFYAPWCGHCKAMKGDYAGAAQKLAGESDLLLSAVDATVQPQTAQRFEIRGYPSLKYFRKGQLVEDYKGGRRKMDFFEFLKKKKKAAAKEEL